MNIRNLIIALLNMDYLTFISVLEFEDNSWSQKHFSKFREDLAFYLVDKCDETNLAKLVNWAMAKAGGEI